MEDTAKRPRRHQSQLGFTLVEVLVVVAIISLLASIAIPALQRAMLRSKRNAAASELKTLRDALSRYAADEGGFPEWGDLDLLTLEPLIPTYVQHSKPVLHNLRGHRIDLYVPWNVIDLDDPPTDWKLPQSFFLVATLGYDRDIRFIVTDGTIYYWMNGKLTPIGDA